MKEQEHDDMRQDFINAWNKLAKAAEKDKAAHDRMGKHISEMEKDKKEFGLND